LCSKKYHEEEDKQPVGTDSKKTPVENKKLWEGGGGDTGICEFQGEGEKQGEVISIILFCATGHQIKPFLKGTK